MNIRKIEKFWATLGRRERTKLAKEVAMLTGKSVNGVFNWFRGVSIPQSKTDRRILSEKTGIPENDMFKWIEVEDE